MKSQNTSIYIPTSTPLPLPFSVKYNNCDELLNGEEVKTCASELSASIVHVLRVRGNRYRVPSVAREKRPQHVKYDIIASNCLRRQ